MIHAKVGSGRGRLRFDRRRLGALIAVVALLAMVLAPFVESARAATTPHAPIVIVGDADLVATAAAEGWPGSGSAFDPIVVAGVEISADAAARSAMNSER